MTKIRLAALSDSLAKTYGVLQYTGSGAVIRGKDGQLDLVCGQCNHVIGSKLLTIPPFVNAVANCPGCGVNLHLTRPSKYKKPIFMKRDLSNNKSNLKDLYEEQKRNLIGSLLKNTPGKYISNKFIEDAVFKYADILFVSQEKYPNVIYHYTSNSALNSILSSGVIWAADIGYMNDSSELEYATDLISHELNCKVKTSNSFVSEFLRNIKLFTLPTDAWTGYYVSCFCSNDDLLSQWRAYGQDGKGIALGFNAFGFSDNQHRLRKVVYDSDAQRELIRETINVFVLGLEENIRNKPKGIANEKILTIFTEILSQSLNELKVSFKHPAFSEEGEWRLIREFTRDVDLEFLKFRNSNDLLIPYLEICPGGRRPDDKRGETGPLLPLIDIVIGPTLHPELCLKSTHLLLEHHGYEHVEVTASATPLRSS